MLLSATAPELRDRYVTDRKRIPLPPQSEQWKTSAQGPPTPTRDVSPPPTDAQPAQSLSFLETIKFLGFNPVNETPWDGKPLNDHLIRLFDHDPNNQFFATPRRPPPTMNVDGPPPPRNDNSGRSSMGGMYSDRMPAASAPDTAPRAPRAMAPRDGGAYSSGPSTLSPTSSYSMRPNVPPINDLAGPPPSRGGRARPNTGPPRGDRRWEPNDAGRQSGFAGPSPIDRPMDVLPPPPRRANDMSRNLPERPPPVAPDVPQVGWLLSVFEVLELTRQHCEQRGMGRGPPPRMTGTNSIPIGPRTAAYEGAPPLDPQPSFRQANNDHDSYRPPPTQNVDRVGEPMDPYSKRVCYLVLELIEMETLTFRPSRCGIPVMRPLPNSARAQTASIVAHPLLPLIPRYVHSLSEPRFRLISWLASWRH